MYVAYQIFDLCYLLIITLKDGRPILVQCYVVGSAVSNGHRTTYDITLTLEVPQIGLPIA
jgi:hypothetical protein